METRGRIVNDRYRVLSLLGEGAMGRVYLAEDTELSRQVALKVLRQELASRLDVQQRLQNECKILARLGPHTNIVTLYDRLVYDGCVVLVMEYVPAEPLTEIIARSQRLQNDPNEAKRTVATGTGMSVMVLRQRDALDIADQCLAALEFAHSKDILHRDIKPGNVMVTRDHNDRLVAKVMDFGIGKALTGGSEPGVATLTMASGPGPGTPAYMAPEQIDAARFGPVGRAADLYAMGITLYEMLTLTLPFQGTYTELLHAHTNVEPPDPAERNAQVSSALQKVLQKALRKNPNERYQNAADFRVDLRMAEGGAGGTVLSTGSYGGSRDIRAPLGRGAEKVAEAGTTPKRRKKGISFGMIVLLLVLCGAGAGWYFYVKPTESSSPSPIPALTPTSLPMPVVSPTPSASPAPTVPPTVAPLSPDVAGSSPATPAEPTLTDRVRVFVKDVENGNAVYEEAISQRDRLLEEARAAADRSSIDKLTALAPKLAPTPIPALVPTEVPEPSPPVPTTVPEPSPRPAPSPTPEVTESQPKDKTQQAIDAFGNVEQK